MSSAVLRVLYRSLLLSAQQLERDVTAGRTLNHALRSGATQSYDGVKTDWQRERSFEKRLSDAEVLRHWRPEVAAILVRTQFDLPVDSSNRRAVNQRIDADLDDHNALIRNLTAQGAFVAKKRSETIRHRVGDVVQVKNIGTGVVVAWSETRAHPFGALCVTYDVLPDATTNQSVGDGTRLYRIPQDDIELLSEPKPVQHPSILLYFDGFRNGRHVPCVSLARRYPEDAGDATFLPSSSEMPYVPSILQLQFADEQKLVQYLRCDDTTVIQFALAALEGKWMSECGDEAQQNVRLALHELKEGAVAQARELLEQVVARHPSYAYAWSKLGTVELQAGNTPKALEHYERALQLKPQLMDALAGLGTCATRLRRWNVAHRAAIELLRVQPNNETARLLLDNAILSSL
ncbi:hypothetical protein ATCC90586_005312 [Pythium insidiosum]|nr:hypothetical protein ATCC90586_005312 [Pythium insidiosum]